MPYRFCYFPDVTRYQQKFKKNQLFVFEVMFITQTKKGGMCMWAYNLS